MTKEKWKDIVGYEGLYKISNKGRVRSLRNDIILKVGLHKQGYFRIVLCKNGERKNHSCHRLVAKHFLEDEDFCVNHKDGNKANNNVDNLEWCSMEDNNIHAIESGLNPRVELTEQDIKDIRLVYEQLKVKQSILAEIWGVSRVTIYRILNNKRYFK